MPAKTKLVARAKKGDRKAFQKLMDYEKEKLYKMAFVYMKNEEDALEVFQETMYSALRSITSLKNNRYFSTWITRILINNAMDALRNRQKVVPLNQEWIENEPNKESIVTEDRLDLLDALGQMNDKYTTVLLLRYYEDYTISQIAEFLHQPEGTVKTNIRRGLEILKKKMKGVYIDERQDAISQKGD